MSHSLVNQIKFDFASRTASKTNCVYSFVSRNVGCHVSVYKESCPIFDVFSSKSINAKEHLYLCLYTCKANYEVITIKN